MSNLQSIMKDWDEFQSSVMDGWLKFTNEKKRGSDMKLAEEFFALKRRKEDINQQLKAVNEAIEIADKELQLWLESNELEQIKTSEGTLFPRTECYARIEDEDLAFDWLKLHDMNDVIKRTVHGKTLASIAKDNPDIPGVVTSFVTKMGMRRS